MAIEILYLPEAAAFIFVFAVVYGLLSYADVLKHKGVNIAIAAVFAAFSVMYEPFVSSLQDFIPIATVVLVVIFFIMLVKKVFTEKGGDTLPLAVALAILLLLLATIWDSVTYYLPLGISPDNALWVIGVIIIIILFAAVYKHKENP